MSIRTIAIHLAGDAEQENRLQTSIGLAQRLRALLVGIYATHGGGMPDGVAGRAASSAFLREIEEATRERATMTRSLFERACKSHTLDHEWIAAPGEATRVLAAQSTVSDLLVLGKSGASLTGHLVAPHGPGEMAMEAACPVLVLPEGKTDQPIGRRILIGWKPTRPTGRAVRGSLSLLRQAEQVILAVIDEQADMLANSGKAARWLSTQDISVNVVVANGLGRKPSERLREIALAHGCDLMVIGAYGRSPIRESLLGGVTADFLVDPRLPLVMSH